MFPITTQEIRDLRIKIGQLTKFIETKGLTEAFKEFLKPKTIIETLKEKKRVVADRAALPKKLAKRGIVR